MVRTLFKCAELSCSEFSRAELSRRWTCTRWIDVEPNIADVIQSNYSSFRILWNTRELARSKSWKIQHFCSTFIALRYSKQNFPIEEHWWRSTGHFSLKNFGLCPLPCHTGSNDTGHRFVWSSLIFLLLWGPLYSFRNISAMTKLIIFLLPFIGTYNSNSNLNKVEGSSFKPRRLRIQHVSKLFFVCLWIMKSMQ